MTYASRREDEDHSRRYAAEDYHRRLDSYHKATALVVKERADLYNMFARPVLHLGTEEITMELPPEVQKTDDYLAQMMEVIFLKYFPAHKTFDNSDE